MVKRIVVGAGYGLGDWLVQRVSALVMAVYSLILGGILLVCTPMTQHEWQSLMAGSCMRFLTLLFILSLCYHAWVGVRDIWMDYVNPIGVRLTLHSLTALSMIGCAGWATQIIWRL